MKATLVALTTVVVLIGSAAQADDWKDESGKGRGNRDRGVIVQVPAPNPYTSRADITTALAFQTVTFRRPVNAGHGIQTGRQDSTTVLQVLSIGHWLVDGGIELGNLATM
jgi:hypothetical protein